MNTIMETSTFNEMNRLQIIETKVKDVQEVLSTRLPSQYRHLVVMVCGTKWRLQTFKPEDTAAVVKKTRVELGSFDYRVKEQAELLTRYLLDLDGVLSHGNTDIKSARKALVVFIQQELLPEADTLKERSAKLKQFGEDALNIYERQILESAMQCENDTESDGDMYVKALFDESKEESIICEEESGVEEDVVEKEEEEVMEDAEDEGMEESADAKQNEFMESESTKTNDQDAEADEEVKTDDDAEKDEQVDLQGQSPHLQSTATIATPTIDMDMLPKWRPYYQLQRRQDGIYLIARLNDIDPQNVRVQWNDYTGVLRISGFRLPTQKDVVMSRLSGAPTFGRFEIIEQFPRNMLNMQEATQQILENGILQIRMPYYVARGYPLRYHPASLFQPQDCFVW